MESYSKKRLVQIKAEIDDINKDIKQFKKEKSVYEIKYRKVEKDYSNGIAYSNTGESLEELMQYYELQIGNLNGEIESLEESKQ